MNFITLFTTFTTLLAFFFSLPLVQALPVAEPAAEPAMLMGQRYARWQPGTAVGYKGAVRRDQHETREQRFQARQLVQAIVQKALDVSEPARSLPRAAGKAQKLNRL